MMPDQGLDRGFICDPCVNISRVSDKPAYKPTSSDYAMASAVSELVDAMLSGEIQNVGVCATRSDGPPIYFYHDKDEADDMMRPMSMLMGLYRANQKFRRQITAPRNNRSYLAH